MCAARTASEILTFGISDLEKLSNVIEYYFENGAIQWQTSESMKAV